MKRLLLAAAALGLAGTIGTANAVPLTATSLTIWGADTPGDISTSLRQQGLPTASGLFAPGAPPGLPLISPNAAAAGPINFTDAGANTVPGFIASSPGFTYAGCLAVACSGSILSNGSFQHATLFEFFFTVAAAGTLTITHDDGVSLYVAGTEVVGAVGPDLLPVASSAPTTSAVDSVAIAPGTYHLWYSESNGLPAILQTNFVATPAVPEPASLTLLGSALVGLGWLGRRRRKSA